MMMRLILKWRVNIEIDKQDAMAIIKLRSSIKAAREEALKHSDDDELKYIIQCRYLEDKVGKMP